MVYCGPIVIVCVPSQPSVCLYLPWACPACNLAPLLWATPCLVALPAQPYSLTVWPSLVAMPNLNSPLPPYVAGWLGSFCWLRRRTTTRIPRTLILYILVFIPIVAFPITPQDIDIVTLIVFPLLLIWYSPIWPNLDPLLTVKHDSLTLVLPRLVGGRFTVYPLVYLPHWTDIYYWFIGPNCGHFMWTIVLPFPR